MQKNVNGEEGRGGSGSCPRSALPEGLFRGGSMM